MLSLIFWTLVIPFRLKYAAFGSARTITVPVEYGADSSLAQTASTHGARVRILTVRGELRAPLSSMALGSSLPRFQF